MSDNDKNDKNSLWDGINITKRGIVCQGKEGYSKRSPVEEGKRLCYEKTVIGIFCPLEDGEIEIFEDKNRNEVEVTLFPEPLNFQTISTKASNETDGSGYG